MSFKRNFMPDFYKQRKKICRSTEETPSTDVKSSLLILHSLFPIEKFENRIPVVIMKNQLYSLNENKTEVDRQLNDLRNKGEIRFFHLGDEDDLCIIFTDEYKTHVQKLNPNNPLIDKFLNWILPASVDISLTKEILAEKFNFKEKEITELIRCGLLTVRDIGTWWISFPGAGEFMKSFIKGRKSILQSFRRAKYGEILKVELEKRQLPKTAKLGITYHIHDIIGAELVDSIKTTSGQLLRAKEL